MSRLYFGLILLAITGLIAIVGPLVETRQRAPEGIARAYLRAVEQDDLEGALATIDPEQREASREQIAWQLRNRYAIVTVVLGKPSVADAVTRHESRAAWVTILANVTSVAGDRWRSTSTAPLVQRDGVWYLARPLFA